MQGAAEWDGPFVLLPEEGEGRGLVSSLEGRLGQMGTATPGQLFLLPVRPAPPPSALVSYNDWEEVGRGAPRGPTMLKAQASGSEANRTLTFLGLPKGPRLLQKRMAGNPSRTQKGER